mgnify:FL=1
MSKGYMAKVAEALGVELGEVFKISKEGSNEKFTKYFRITHDNIEESEYQSPYSHWSTCNSEVLLRLLNGSFTLCKSSWKPKDCEEYYTPYIDRCDKFYSCWVWKGTVGDMDRYEHGLVCKTEEEATELSKEIRNKVKEAKYCG